VAEASVDIARELESLEVELRRLEAEYNMFFGGRLPRPPLETRRRVAALVTRFDRRPPSNYGARFRFTSLQSRFMAFSRLWDRGLKAREEGCAGPFAQSPSTIERAAPPRDRVLALATVSDAADDYDKVQELFESFASARREAGQAAVSLQSFEKLIRTQVGAFKQKGCSGVAFRVALKDGKTSFSGRAMRAVRESEA